MGFLKNFSEPFAFALALWPFVSMLLTVPVLNIVGPILAAVAFTHLFHLSRG